MRQFKTAIVSLVLLIFLSSVFALADEKTQYKTTIPTIQTVEWAVKWWGPRHEEKVQQVKQGNVDLLLIGDSITHNWENERGINVWNKYYKHRHAVNLGFSGDRTEHVLWRLQNGEIDNISPKLAVVMIGTNNTGQRRDPVDETAAGVKAILDQVQSKLPETKILLLAIFPRSELPGDSLRVMNEEINNIISGYADNQRIYFLDINDKFLDDNGVLTKEIMPDFLHPNEKGYRIWAESMEPMVSELLRDQAVSNCSE